MSSRILPGIVFLFFVTTAAFSQPTDPIRIKSGLIAGANSSDPAVRAYLGIPYAAPPVRDLRWKPPQPVKPWQGIRQASAHSPACIQNLPGSRLPWTEEFMHQGAISEDCLYLNVWSGATSSDEKRPVMVYIYGGGFSEGSNAVAVYEGTNLAKKDVVVVGINYRVGILGFLAHPEFTAESKHQASGNYGLLDQVAALRWVQENIRAFGGDPEQVTIFGQSAGAMSVAMLMHSPLARGLFTRAIIQSGPGLFSSTALFGGTPLSVAEERGLQFAETKEAGSIQALRDLSAEELRTTNPISRMGPVMDGWFLPEDGLIHDQVPVMNGFTADDLGAGGGGFGPPPEPTVATYENDAREAYGDKADTFLSLYPATSDADVPALRKTSNQDRARVSLHLWASNQKKMSDSVFTYYFNRAIPWPEHPEFGAFHTGEVPYVYNNLHLLNRPWEPVDRTVADKTSSYWVNFAKHGDPNGEGLSMWPAFDAGATTMEIGAKMGTMPIAEPAKIEFWIEILTAWNESM